MKTCDQPRELRSFSARGPKGECSMAPRQEQDGYRIPFLPWDVLPHSLTSEPFNPGYLLPGLSFPLSQPSITFSSSPQPSPFLLTLTTLLLPLTQAASLKTPFVPPPPNVSIEQESIGGWSQVTVSQRSQVHHQISLQSTQGIKVASNSLM